MLLATAHGQSVITKVLNLETANGYNNGLHLLIGTDILTDNL